MKRRRVSVIDRLRALYPGTWTWDRKRSRWVHSDGWEVAPYARWSPQYEGDDESFVTEYRRTDTGELVLSSAQEFEHLLKDKGEERGG